MDKFFVKDLTKKPSMRHNDTELLNINIFHTELMNRLNIKRLIDWDIDIAL